MSRALAVKTAGSLMPCKLVRQCGSEPRAQYSDDVTASGDAADDLVWETTLLHGPGRRGGANKEMSCPRSEARLAVYL